VTLFDDVPGRALEIVDDGSGMDWGELADGFMRLAGGQRVSAPVSPRFNRVRAGKKGIGRFASERLGAKLIVITSKEGEGQALGVDVDWTAFKQGTELSSVGNSIQSVRKERPHGTRLRIENLRDSWSDAELRRIFRYVLTLRQPEVGLPSFGLEQTEQGPTKDSSALDPGFEVKFERGTTILTRSVADAGSEVLGQALAVVTARVDHEGIATWSMVAPRQELIVRDERIGAEPDSANALRNARDVELRAYYFIYAREFLGRSTNAIRDYVGEQGGIRVYRNGYRVLPYGTSADDWLGLDEAYVRRSVTAPIANRNYLGWVTLTDPSGIIFEETSSREGLIENAAFDEVRRLISSVLVTAAVRIEASRGMGKKPPRPDQDPEKGRRAELEAESAATQLELIITEGERSHARRVGDEASTELQRATAELLNAVRQTLRLHASAMSSSRN
jgi:hypothetical protein